MLFHSALDNLTMDFEFEGVRVVSGEDKEREKIRLQSRGSSNLTRFLIFVCGLFR